MTTATQQNIFQAAGPLKTDPARTGGLRLAADEMFSAITRIQLDETSWVDYVPGWLTGDGELMRVLMDQAEWEQRARWMYTRRVDEPRLTAEYPVIDDAPQPALRYLAGSLAAHYRRPYTRVWMNWYRDNSDGTGWHADRPPNQLASPAPDPGLAVSAAGRPALPLTSTV